MKFFAGNEQEMQKNEQKWINYLAQNIACNLDINKKLGKTVEWESKFSVQKCRDWTKTSLFRILHGFSMN